MADPKQAALAAAWAVQQAGADAWNNLCELFVEQAYGTSGVFPSAKDAIPALKPRRSLDGAKPGDVVLFAADSSNQFHGHAGIYLGNGRMVSATPQGVKETGILDDPYYSRLFVGIGEAPAEWKGQASTDKLEQGAQRILQTAGATNMADSNKVTALKREERDLAARLAQNKTDAAKLAEAQRIVSDYNADRKTPTDKWLASRGLTQEELDRAKDLVSRGDEITKQVTEDEKALRTLRVQLGDAEDDARTASTPKPDTSPAMKEIDGKYFQYDAASGSWVPAKGLPQAAGDRAAPKTFQGQDGLQYLLSDDGKTATLVKGQAQAPAKQTTYQIVTNPADKSTWTFDPAKGQLITQLFEGPAPVAPQPENVSAPTNQPKLVRRDPKTGALITEANPNYQAPEPKAPSYQSYGDPIATYNGAVQNARAIAQGKSDELKRRVEGGELTLDQARSEFGTWWTQYVEAPLAGYKTAAEQATQKLQYDNEAAQRTEDQRAETINRQRQTTALQAGDVMRDKAAALAPGVRSAAFLDKYAQGINAFSGNSAAPTFSAADFQPDPGQIPDINAMAEQEVARVLAHISPAAAAKVGRPMPQLPQGPALEAFIPQYAPTG